MRVERTVKILLAPNLTSEEATVIAEQEGCSGFYLSIPPSMIQYITEDTVYPFVVTQVFEDIIDE